MKIIGRMKTGLAIIVGTLSLATSLSANAQSFKGKNYIEKCRFEHPLSTFEGCHEYSYAGRRAAECASALAEEKCRGDFSSDCVYQGVTFKTIISHEFIGYRACQATVVYHGYKITN